MRIVKKLTDNKFLNLKEVRDPENNVNGYQFAERLGKDSVAFILWDNDSEQFLLNKEYKPPIDSMMLGSFGGSIDKDKFLVDIVIDEVREEAGFIVEAKDVKYVGRFFVSTQMNQYCHLYIVFVDKNKQVEREPENEIEKIATVSWHSLEEIYKIEDWKPIVIVEKAKEKNIIAGI
jgi:8-oxo-dGTP pyrophosphatase MutT (NUDIX family)